MKEVTRYISDDRGEFSTKEQALLCDSIQHEVEALMAEVPITKELNWDGYYQRTPEQIQKIREGLLKIAARVSDHRWVRESLEPKTHASYAARIIGELPYRTLDMAWNRVCCIDSKGREWNQPFLAEHPDQGKDVCLNP